MEKVAEIYIPEKEVSNRTYIALQTLRNHRHTGRGIPYIKLNRSVRYKLQDVIDFMESRRVKTIDAD